MKKATAFVQKSHVKSMIWPAKSPELNPKKILWWKFQKIVNEKDPSTKDLLIAIRGSWKLFNKEYCFKQEKPTPEKMNEEEKLSINSSYFIDEFNIF